MEIPPDSLEAGGVNSELSVAAAVDESVTTAQTASASFGTHRERSSNSNTEFMSIISALNSGAVSSIVLKRGSSIAPIHRIFEFLTKAARVSGPWVEPRPSPPSFPLLRCLVIFFHFFPSFFFNNIGHDPHSGADASTECVFVGLGDKVKDCSFCGLCFLVIS
jgi:hypothetical protein